MCLFINFSVVMMTTDITILSSVALCNFIKSSLVQQRLFTFAQLVAGARSVLHCRDGLTAF